MRCGRRGTCAQRRQLIGRRTEMEQLEDVEGSTFSVSNLGPFDVDHFSAIINPPESGIVAVGSAKKVPVVLEDGTTASVYGDWEDGVANPVTPLGQMLRAFTDRSRPFCR